jgi:hypothetical protein
MKKLFAFFTAFIIWNTQTAIATDVSGFISTNTTWNLISSPYTVTSNVLVGSGITLTIEPGVIIKFTSGTALQIDGQLIARGSSGNQITFTSNQSTPAPGDWGYILFSNSSTDASYDENENYTGGSILEYCIVEYAGGSVITNNGALRIDNCSPFINRSTIRKNYSGINIFRSNDPWNAQSVTILDTNIESNYTNNMSSVFGGAAIYAEGSLVLKHSMVSGNNGAGVIVNSVGGGTRPYSGPMTLTENIVTNNTGTGVSAYYSVTLTNNEISGNGHGGFVGYAGVITLTGNMIKNNTNNTSFWSGDVGNGGGATVFAHTFPITIKNNTICNNVTSISGGGVDIGGTYAGGTVILENNVIYNNRASTTGGGVNGLCDGVTICNNIISNNTATQGGGIYGSSGGSVNTTVTRNSIIRNSAQQAGAIQHDFGGDFKYNTISGNVAIGTAPTYTVHISSDPFFNDNNIFNNTATYTLWNNNTQGSANLNCTNNFWETTTSSEIQTKIYDWFDDATKGMVDFSPFLTSPDTAAPVIPPSNVKKSIVGGSVHLTWNANPESDISGYRIHYGSPTGYSYANSIDVVNVTSYTLSGVSISDTIAVTAYDVNRDGSNDQCEGHESWFTVASMVSPVEPIIASPVISYATPQTYIIGTSITPLVPTNSGGAVPATEPGLVATLAGSTTAGSSDGNGTAASFNYPWGVAVDGSGNVYAADASNKMIRKITPSGVVTTLAGSTTAGSSNGIGTAASFNLPTGVAVDGSGNVYVADASSNMIRKITAAGVVTTLAGSTTPGSYNGTGTSASFYNPYGVAVDASGNVYVADALNNMIRKITSSGVVTTLAGSTTSGSSNGTGTLASFKYPYSITVDDSGNVYVADYGNHMIRKITSSGVVTTVAGSTTSGSSNGIGTAAKFYYPYGVTVDSTGNVYVADNYNHLIRKITPSGLVTTLAGSTTPGSTNGIGTAASFRYPSGVAVDGSGSVYVADYGNHMIRKISQTGYSISPALPVGLNFDATTGTISGTPTTGSPSTIYTITATNSGGSNSTTINITVLTPVAPTVITRSVNDITVNAATVNSSISNIGLPNPTQHGIVWSTAANPTVSLSTKTERGTVTDTVTFTSSITGLSPKTTHHVRAYATNTAGTAYGEDLSFTTHDITRNITIQIGTGGTVKDVNVILNNNAVLTIERGLSKTFTIVPDSGYQIATLAYNGTNVKEQVTNNQYTTPSLIDNSILIVTFEEIPYIQLMESKKDSSIYVNCNKIWIAASDKAWLSISKTTGSGNDTITYSMSKNPTISERTATVTITVDASNSKSIVITQAPGDPILTVTLKTLTIEGTSSESHHIFINSNTIWEANSNQSWLTVSPTTGSGTDTLTIHSETNPDPTLRTAILKLTALGVSDQSITITQAGDTTISVSVTSLSIGAEVNAMTNCSITSNSPWTAASNQTWLKVENPSGTGNATLNLTAQGNPLREIRTANVNVWVSPNYSSSFEVSQSPGNGDGTFRQLPGERETESGTGLLAVLYPNPATEEFQIVGNFLTARIEIFDSTGKRHLIKDIINNERISLFGLPKGIFFIRIITLSALDEKILIIK